MPLPLVSIGISRRIWGGYGTRAFSTQSVIAAYHQLAQVEGAANGVISQKQISAKLHLNMVAMQTNIHELSRASLLSI